jgi:hypothetical protein
MQCAQYESGEAEGLSPELQAALQPLLSGLESLSEQIRQYNERIEKLGTETLSAGGAAEADSFNVDVSVVPKPRQR